MVGFYKTGIFLRYRHISMELAYIYGAGMHISMEQTCFYGTGMRIPNAFLRSWHVFTKQASFYGAGILDTQKTTTLSMACRRFLE